MAEPTFPAPSDGMVATMLFIVADHDRTRDFYRDVLGAQVVLERDPVIMQFHNTWLIFNVGRRPDR